MKKNMEKVRAKKLKVLQAKFTRGEKYLDFLLQTLWIQGITDFGKIGIPGKTFLKQNKNGIYESQFGVIVYKTIKSKNIIQLNLPIEDRIDMPMHIVESSND